MLWWDFTIDHWRIVLASPVSNEEGVELLILCPTRGKVQSQCHAASAVKINKLRSSRWKRDRSTRKDQLGQIVRAFAFVCAWTLQICRIPDDPASEAREREGEWRFRWDVPVARSSHWNLFMCFLGNVYIWYIIYIILYTYVSISAYIYIYMRLCVYVCM